MTPPRVGAPRATTKPFRQGRFEELPERPRIPHRYYDADTEEIVVDSRPFGRVRTHVVSYGKSDGPPLLLVHGLMTSSYSWRYALDELGDRFRLVAPDLPGAGRSDAVPDRPHTAAALATFISELQAALGIAGCQAVGNSLGGHLCMRAALRDPASFERLAVIHAPAFPDARQWALSAALKVPGVAAVLQRVIRRDPLRFAHRNVHYYDETLKSLEEAREYGEPLAGAAGARVFTRYLGEALDPRALHAFLAALRARRRAEERFPVSLMLVYAREDPIVEPSNGPRLHALVPDAEFHWIDRSSHFAHVDSPDRLAALLERFLRVS